jgi:hypothetical protein
MVFDAHDRAFALFKGTCRRGNIYDNMKTAGDGLRRQGPPLQSPLPRCAAITWRRVRAPNAVQPRAAAKALSALAWEVAAEAIHHGSECRPAASGKGVLSATKPPLEKRGESGTVVKVSSENALPADLALVAGMIGLAGNRPPVASARNVHVLYAKPVRVGVTMVRCPNEVGADPRALVPNRDRPLGRAPPHCCQSSIE